MQFRFRVSPLNVDSTSRPQVTANKPVAKCWNQQALATCVAVPVTVTAHVWGAVVATPSGLALPARIAHQWYLLHQSIRVSVCHRRAYSEQVRDLKEQYIRLLKGTIY